MPSQTSFSPPFSFPSGPDPNAGFGANMPPTFNWNNSAANYLGNLGRIYAPQIGYMQGLQGPIGQAFMSNILTPGANFGPASTAFEGTLSNLFAPGGQVQSQVGRARGDMISKGFAPGGAEGSVNDIIKQALQYATGQFAQNAAGLEEARLGQLGGAFKDVTGNINDLLGSYGTSQFGAANFDLAQASVPKQGLLGLGFGPL